MWNRLKNFDSATFKVAYTAVVCILAFIAYRGGFFEVTTAGQKAAFLGLCAAALFIVNTIPSIKPVQLLIHLVGAGLTFLTGYYWLLSETPENADFALSMVIVLIGLGLTSFISILIWGRR